MAFLLEDQSCVEEKWGTMADVRNIQKVSKSALAGKGLLRAKEQTEAYLKNIIAKIPGSIYWKDKNGVFLGCNEFVARMAGLTSPEEVIGKSDKELVWKEHAETLRKTDQMIMESEAETNIEEVVTLADGSTITMLTNKAPLYDNNGRVIGVLGVSIDITEKKMMEQSLLLANAKAEAASEAKSEFMANMSHDLRTPLTGILGLVEILAGKSLTAEQQKTYLTALAESANRLLDVVETILDFDRLYSGRIDIASDPFDLQVLIESVVDNIGHQAREKLLDIVIDYPADVPRFIIGDTKCVTQILLNLMGNAIKYTDKGQIMIGVDRLTHYEDNGELMLQFTVEDSGIGISKENLDRIFGCFNRLEPSYKGLRKGSGLGLTIVQEIVRKLKGEISVNSSPGVGSTFRVKIPFKPQSTCDVISTWHTEFPDVRVLIVDDETIVGTSVLKYLSSQNCMSCHSHDVLNVLIDAAHQKQPYEIIIVNDTVTAFEPTQLIETICYIDLIGSPLTLCLSKPGTADYLLALKTSGFFDYILKPIKPSQLCEKLTQCWQRWQERVSAETLTSE